MSQLVSLSWSGVPHFGPLKPFSLFIPELRVYENRRMMARGR